jgi:endonuclease/exonuclease/phosphatase (EEP) superfamily protein YafD
MKFTNNCRLNRKITRFSKICAIVLILIGCSNREAVTGVLLDRNELSLVNGETATLTATVLPHNADNKAVSWRSSIPAIAFVSDKGKITALGVGETVVGVVTEDGGKTATCAVTVTPADVPVTGVSLNRSELALFAGETATLVATVVPNNATDKTVSWNSNAPSIARVDASTGEVTAIAVGNALISAITGDGAKTATCNLTVTEKIELRVMSFNIWVGGGRSVERTVAAINESNADIVGIQEDANGAAAAIAQSLGWRSVHTYSTLLGKACAIISKYPVIAYSATKTGVKLQISENKYVWMFNQHLNHCPYEPYRLNEIAYCGYGTIYTEAEAIASAWNARKGDVERTVSEIKTAQKEQTPIFLTGDFNEPSWLDWTARATVAGLCKIPVAWPATKTVQEQTGMTDSYRTFYPDEIAKPGYTWTPLPATREIHDRIDFVFFWGDGIQLVKSEIVGEKKPESDIVIQSYPSDHRAVLSTFRY